MIIREISKDKAEELISALADLRSEMACRIIDEDYPLHQLDLISYIPCSLEIDASEEEISEVVMEVCEMEAEAFGFDESDLRRPEIAKRQKMLEDRYRRFEVILNYLEGRNNVQIQDLKLAKVQK